MHLTQKQMEIMTVVVAGEGKDTAGNLLPIDMDQLLERITYKTTKESMQFSIRALIKNGLLYKGARLIRRGRQRITFMPTDLGKHMTMLGKSPSFIEPHKTEADELLDPQPSSADASVPELLT